MADPGGRQTLVPTALALAFPEHADAPARGAGMLYSHHSGSAACNNSQLLPKGIFSCIIYLNTCLRLQGRVRSLSSEGRERGKEGGREERHQEIWTISTGRFESRDTGTMEQDLGYAKGDNGAARITHLYHKQHQVNPAAGNSQVPVQTGKMLWSPSLRHCLQGNWAH